MDAYCAISRRASMKIFFAPLLVALAACTSAPPGAIAKDAPKVRVEQAWVHSAPKGQFETWAFARIANPGATDALVEVRTTDAESVVLRATTVTDAGRKTRSVAAIPVPAHGSLDLSADTYFIAFVTARHAFVAGQTVSGTFRFSSGAEVPVTFQVTGAEGDPADSGK
jgi:copper(I)-binding protein